jgi:predicted dehydrogenase
MGSPIRIGVVGCGSVSRAYASLIDVLRKPERVEVVAACDVKEDDKAGIEARFQNARFTTDYKEVVQSEDVDLVLVLTSMPEHGPITRAALEAGKHVLVEKPMSVNLKEAAEIVELSKSVPGYLLPAPHVILSPTYQTIWKRIHNGDIGQVVAGRGIYGHGGPTWGPWFYRQGGGALFDLGVYNVTSLTGLLGPVQRVTALTGIATPVREMEGQTITVEAEDNAQVLLDFGNAVFANITTGFSLRKYRCPAIEIYGREGTIQMMGDDWAPNGYELWQLETRSWQIFQETSKFWPWTDGLRHLVECIERETAPIITPEHAYHVLEIMVRAQESGREGVAKDIESTFPPLPYGEPGASGDQMPDHDHSVRRT